jgi:hypothetical protein
MTDTLTQAADRYEQAAAELERAAQHCRVAAAHYRDQEIPAALRMGGQPTATT